MIDVRRLPPEVTLLGAVYSAIKGLLWLGVATSTGYLAVHGIGITEPQPIVVAAHLAAGCFCAAASLAAALLLPSAVVTLIVSIRRMASS